MILHAQGLISRSKLIGIDHALATVSEQQPIQ